MGGEADARPILEMVVSRQTIFPMFAGLDIKSRHHRGLTGHWLPKLERPLRPRFGVMVETALAIRPIGLASLPLAAILLLPLPIFHMLHGFAVACVAGGLVERDGVMVAAGSALAMVTLCLAAARVSFARAGFLSLIG